MLVKSLRPRQNGRHFADDIFMCICVSEFHSHGSNEPYSSIGLDDGLAPARRQAIIWTNDVKFTEAYMLHAASTS